MRCTRSQRVLDSVEHLCEVDFTRIRPARTISDGNMAGQFTPRHSCLCSGKHSIGLESLHKSNLYSPWLWE